MSYKTDFGNAGVDRIEDTGLHTGNWYYVRSLNGSVVLGADCAVIRGDSLQEDDVITEQGVGLPIKALRRKSGGVLLAYRVS